MPDPRFFPPRGPFSLSQLAEMTGAAIAGSAGGDIEIVNVAPLQDAAPGDISFLDNKAYADAFSRTRASACVIDEKFIERAPDGIGLLVTSAPYLAYARIANAFHPPREVLIEAGAGGAHVDESARIGAGTTIGRGAIICANAQIGANCIIGTNAYIAENVVIGDDCRIGIGASVRYALVGNRVVLYPGVRIGEAGFGFAISPEGAVTVAQVGRVIIEDDVEIGPNSTVDRGAGPDTVIGAGTRIDNLVQIGHNVRIGRGCILVAQSGVAGSSVLGNGVQVGGQAGIAGHLNIGDGARIAAKSGVMKDIPAGVAVAGIPAMPIKQFFRQVAAVARLAEKRDV